MEHRLSSCAVQALESTGSVVAALKLSCSKACGVLVSPPGTEPASPALQGRLLNTGPPERSQRFSVCYLYFYSACLLKISSCCCSVFISILYPFSVVMMTHFLWRFHFFLPLLS